MVKDFNPQILEDTFRDLQFTEEGHSYFFKGKRVPISVSGFLKEFYLPFDSDYHSQRLERKTGRPAEDYLLEWRETNREAITRGSRVHTFAECYAVNRKLKPECKQEEAVKKFLDDLPEHIIIVAIEYKMCMLNGKCAGTTDLLLYNTIKKYFIIADYKTNSTKLFKNFKGQKMLPPFQNLFDTPFSHYECQLSTYQIMFEQTGYKVGRRVLVELCFDGTYNMYDCTDLTEPLRAYMN